MTFNRNKTPEERSIYQLLVILIETYESQQYAMPISPPHEILQHIMESSGISESNLVGKLGSSEVVSEIVNGKLFSEGEAAPTISKAQAEVLGDMFKVLPSLFIL